MQQGACHIDCTSLSDESRLLYGRVRHTCLMPTCLMQVQSLAQVQINQPIIVISGHAFWFYFLATYNTKVKALAAGKMVQT